MWKRLQSWTVCVWVLLLKDPSHILLTETRKIELFVATQLLVFKVCSPACLTTKSINRHIQQSIYKKNRKTRHKQTGTVQYWPMIGKSEGNNRMWSICIWPLSPSSKSTVIKLGSSVEQAVTEIKHSNDQIVCVIRISVNEWVNE